MVLATQKFAIPISRLVDRKPKAIQRIHNRSAVRSVDNKLFFLTTFLTSAKDSANTVRPGVRPTIGSFTSAQICLLISVG